MNAISFNQCIFQYRKAMCDLEKFESSDAVNYLKGFLVFKKEKRMSGNSVKYYTNVYLVKVDYINGRPKRKETYVKKSDVESIQNKLARKQQSRRIYNELKKRVKTLWLRLRRLMRNEKIDTGIFQSIEENWRQHAIFRQTDRYENAKIISALGEQVRSRGECILANLAFAFKIPYFYEPAIQLQGFDEIDDLINETVHPDFVFFVNGEVVLLELLGIPDLAEYKQSWERRHRHYNSSGFIKGKNLICLACKDRQNIDSQIVAQVLINMTNGIIPKENVYV